MNDTDLLDLLREFYYATVNYDSSVCFGCGCVDVERLRANASSWAHPHPHIVRLEKEIAAMRPEDYTHKPDCIIQGARRALGITS